MMLRAATITSRSKSCVRLMAVENNLGSQEALKLMGVNTR